MAKSDKVNVRYTGNFTPHAPVGADGSLVNPVTGEVTYPPTMTKQSMAAQCDINNILKQFKMTGVISHISVHASKGTYQDLPESLDFQESLHTVKRAQDAFASLPSKVRNRFDNDPALFLMFCSDPANAAELVELGLATRSPAPGLATRSPAPVSESQAPASEPLVQPKA